MEADLKKGQAYASTTAARLALSHVLLALLLVAQLPSPPRAAAPGPRAPRLSRPPGAGRAGCEISQDLSLDISGDQWMQDVSIQPRPDEQKMVIEVDARSRDQSIAMANGVGERIVAEVNRINATLEGTARINVQRAQRAREVSRMPNTRVSVFAGAILGLVVGLLFTFILEYLDDTLKTRADVERFLGLTTLGAIPKVERWQVREPPGAAPSSEAHSD